MGGNNDRDIPVHRRARVRDLVRLRRAASIPEIAAHLRVSQSTVRRDLERLSSDGIIERAYGGAVVVDQSTFEPLFLDRRRWNTQEKERIAVYAMSFLERGQSVIFDSSSTVLRLVEALATQPVPITAVTNDLAIATVLADVSEIKLVLTGGELRPGSLTLVGSSTRDFMGNLRVDLAILGIHAITGSTLTDTSISVAEVKRSMLSAARRRVVLADHSKFGPAAFCKVADLTAVNELVTDEGTPASALDAIDREGGLPRVHVV